MIDDIFARIATVAPTATLAWLCAVAVLAGISRGLTGFGSGMIFVPLATGMVNPAAAAGILWAMEGPSVVPLGVGSLKRSQFWEITTIFLVIQITIPIGVMILGMFNPTVLHLLVSALIATGVVMMMTGWRYDGMPTMRLAIITGVIAGVFGGVAGLPGPPIAMLWLAATAATSHDMRDNINVLYLLSLTMNLTWMIWSGVMTANIALAGLFLAVPYTLAIVVGLWVFNRLGERVFRTMSYGVIAFALVLALPAFGWTMSH